MGDNFMITLFAYAATDPWDAGASGGLLGAVTRSCMVENPPNFTWVIDSFRQPPPLTTSERWLGLHCCSVYEQAGSHR